MENGCVWDYDMTTFDSELEVGKDSACVYPLLNRMALLMSHLKTNLNVVKKQGLALDMVLGEGLGEDWVESL